MGKLTISTGPCSIANCNKLPEGKFFSGAFVVFFLAESLQTNCVGPLTARIFGGAASPKAKPGKPHGSQKERWLEEILEV